jgi:hypothetical protein
LLPSMESLLLLQIPVQVSVTSIWDYSETALLFRIWGFHGECHLLRCGAVRVYYKPVFWKNVSPPSSGYTVSNRLILFLACVIYFTLKMEVIHSSEVSIYNKPTWCHFSGDDILQLCYWFVLAVEWTCVAYAVSNQFLAPQKCGFSCKVVQWDL